MTPAITRATQTKEHKQTYIATADWNVAEVKCICSVSCLRRQVFNLLILLGGFDRFKLAGGPNSRNLLQYTESQTVTASSSFMR